MYRTDRKNKLVVNVSKKNMPKVEKIIQREYHREDVAKLLLKEINGEESDPDLLVSYVSEAIGPGGFMLLDSRLEAFDRHIQNKTKRKYSVPHLSEYLLNHTNPSYGTIGCFIKDKHIDEVFVLSVIHLVTEKEDVYEEKEAYMVSGFQHTSQLNIIQPEIIQTENEDFLTETFARDYAHISSKCSGILGTEMINDFPKKVDIGIFGPLSDNIIATHKKFHPSRKQKIKVVKQPDYEIEGEVVHKCGVSTGYTIGKIIAFGSGKVPGTFMVTTFHKRRGTIDKDGNFARKGDSGAIVFLKKEEGFRGIGIVHGTKKEFDYGDKKLRNVVVCVRLDHCITAMASKGLWKESYQLYFYHMKPMLCLRGQELLPGLRKVCGKQRVDSNEEPLHHHISGFQSDREGAESVDLSRGGKKDQQQVNTRSRYYLIKLSGFSIFLFILAYLVYLCIWSLLY